MDVGMMTLSNYPVQTVQERVIELLKQERGNPLTVEDISLKLKMETNTVVHIIHSIQGSYPLCMKNEKIYFPENKMRWWLAAFGLVIACTYTVCEVIKYYHI